MRITKQDMKLHVYPSGAWCIDWRKNELRHREDGPATIWNDGEESYFLEGSHAKSYLKEPYKNIFI